MNNNNNNKYINHRLKQITEEARREGREEGRIQALKFMFYAKIPIILILLIQLLSYKSEDQDFILSEDFENSFVQLINEENNYSQINMPKIPKPESRVGVAFANTGKIVGDLIGNIIISNDRIDDLNNATKEAKEILKDYGFIETEDSDSNKEIITTTSIEEWKSLNIIIHNFESLARVYAYENAIAQIDEKIVPLFYQSISYIDANNNINSISSKQELYTLLGFRDEKEFNEYITDYIQYLNGEIFSKEITISLPNGKKYTKKIKKTIKVL